MGGEIYWYFVEYNADIDEALKVLREREFNAGRYNPVVKFLKFPIGPHSPRPGPSHRSIRDVLENSTADGTRSILDIQGISKEPDDYCAAPVDDAELEALFGTKRPTHEMVETMNFLDDLYIERGQCRYFAIYKNDTPIELLFVGFSFD